MELLQAIGLETLKTLYLAAPFLLFGLLVAGFVHVLLPTSTIQRFMGRPGMSGVTLAALVGVPLPVCSCGVVPISVEMRRKGASQPASLSFLTTTPESSIDSILFTWGLMGPVMAIARPVAAFFTAILGGILAIAYVPEEDPEKLPEAAGHDHGGSSTCGGPTCGDGCGPGADEPAALQALGAWWRRRRGRTRAGDDEVPGLFQGVVRPALRYGFGELLDDLAFWLVLGVVLAGVLGALVPADLDQRGLGSGLMPMLLLLAAGIPLYMCASASTPIAAALMAKGVSPGAALVFLLAGPATNAATVVLLARTFGRRFVQIYVLSVAVGALAAGIALEGLIAVFGFKILVPLVAPGASALAPLEWASFALLVVLLAWSAKRGAFKIGWHELRESFDRLAPRDAAGRRRFFRRGAALVLVLVLLGWAATGLTTVPVGSRGYGFVFGELTRPDLSPGLHVLPPWPFARVEVRRTDYPRKADIGFRTDLELLAKRRDLMQAADPDEWHSPVAAMNVQPQQAAFLTADENLVDMSFTIHYTLSDPAAFLYGLDHESDVVALYAEAEARKLVAGNVLDELLTSRRPDLEKAIEEGLGARLDELGAGVRVNAVRIVDIHPPSGAVYAFRDVSSAREDRETRIDQAYELGARELPWARGEAAKLLAAARARSLAAALEAEGRSASFTARAKAFAVAPGVLGHSLWIEATERALAGREIYVVPPNAEGSSVTLWQNPPPYEKR